MTTRLGARINIVDLGSYLLVYYIRVEQIFRGIGSAVTPEQTKLLKAYSVEVSRSRLEYGATACHRPQHATQQADMMGLTSSFQLNTNSTLTLQTREAIHTVLASHST